MRVGAGHERVVSPDPFGPDGDLAPFGPSSEAVVAACRLRALGAEPSADDDPLIAGAQAAWREASGFDRPPDPTSIVAIPLWERFDAESQAGYRSPGSVAVAGWTSDFTPPADPGARSPVGRTLVVSAAAVGTGGALVDVGVRTEMVRSPVDQNGAGDDPFVFKSTLPGGEPVDTASLVLRTTVTGTAHRAGHVPPLSRPRWCR